jgi:uncharacterized protein YfiM (DUF2279 family)
MTSDSSPAATAEKPAAARWIPPVVWVAIILIGTSWPGVSLGPDGLPLDKVAHFGAYAVLAALILRATRTPHEWRTALVVLVVVSLFGAVDEWHQSFIPRRSMSFADWIADTLGAVCGVLAARSIPFLTRTRPA